MVIVAPQRRLTLTYYVIGVYVGPLITSTWPPISPETSMRSEYTFWPIHTKKQMRVERGTAWVVFNPTADVVADDDGTTWPREFTYVEMPDDRDAAYFVVELEWTGEPLAPRLLAVQAIARDDRRQVSGVDLRTFQLEVAVERACMLAANTPSIVVSDDHKVPAVDAVGRFKDDAARRRTITGLRRQSRNTMTREVLEQVAAVYRGNPTAPTKAVKREFGIADSTASSYVKQAREAGLLPAR
jgi:hypothetical protein